METFSFSPPKKFSEEGIWLLAVTRSEATNSLYNTSDENTTFSISTPGYWTPQGVEETVNKLNELLELRSHNDIELHAKEVKKRSTRIKTEKCGYYLAGFDFF